MIVAAESTAPNPKKRVRLAGAISVAVGILLAVLVPTEFWFRSQIHPVDDERQHVFLRPPLQRIRVQVSEDVPGLAKRETLFTTNALGLRGDDIDLSANDAIRIVTLGGSVTECMVLNDADAWPRQLQDKLAAGTNKEIWVGNAGRSGEMTLDYNAHAQLLLPGLTPDMVVVMPGGNDLQAVSEGRYFPVDLGDSETLFQYAARGLYTRGDTSFLEPLYAYRMLELREATTTQDLGPLYRTMKARRYASAKIASIPDLEDALDTYRTNLRSLYTMLRRVPSKPVLVFMTHPFLWHENMSTESEKALWAGYTCFNCPTQGFYAHEALAKALRAFNAELLKFCEEVDLQCFDLEPQLPKTLENFYDDGHLKEAGAKRVADLLGRFLLENDLLKRKAPRTP